MILTFLCNNIENINKKVVILNIEWYINTYVYQQKLNVQ